MENAYDIKTYQKMYLDGQYQRIIESVYSDFVKNGIRDSEEKKDEIYIGKLLSSSLYLCGYYYDCILTMKALFAVAPLDSHFFDSRDRAHLMDCLLESLLFFIFNNSDLQFDVRSSFERSLEDAPRYYSQCEDYRDEKFRLIAQLYTEFKDGKKPFYEVSFFVPIVLNFDAYAFDLNGAFPYIKLETKIETRGGVAGTVFTTTIFGFIKADSFWMGEQWSFRRKVAVAEQPLNLINKLLLIISEGDVHDFMPRIRPEQLSSITISQFTGSGALYHFCDGTMFDGQYIQKWIQRPKYDADSLRKLNELLVQSCNYPLYAMLYHQAQNTMLGGLYEESAMVFFACVEATVHYWCSELSRLYGIEKEYQEFKEKKHICRDCSLYIQNPSAHGVSTSKMPPSIRNYPRFLRQKEIIEKSMESKMKNLIIAAQNDELRNKIMHGEIGKVSFLQVEYCRKSVYELNACFLSVYDSALSKLEKTQN